MVGANVRVRALSLVAIASLVVTACAPGATQSPAAPGGSTTPGGSNPPASTGPTAQKGGTAFIMMTTATANSDKFTDIDPQRIYIGEDEAFFGATLQQNLTGYKYTPDAKEGTQLVPDAATDTGTPSDGGKTWSFTLRDGLKWQDGSAVKCEDYKYGVSRTFAIDIIVNGPQYAIQYLDIPTNDDGTSKYPGPYKATPDQQALYDKAVVCEGNKITFHLKQALADFNYTVTIGMGAVPNPTDHPGVDTGEQYTNKPWSDGPYMIDSYTPGTGGNLTLVRNPNWGGEAADGGYRGAYPDKWVVNFAIDATIGDGRLMTPSGDDSFTLGYGNVQPQNFTTVFKDNLHAADAYAGRAFSDFDPYVAYWWININKVKNVKIRQAIGAAIDREAIRATSGGDFYGTAGDGLIKPNLGPDYAKTGWETDLFGEPIGPNGNVDLAKKLISESGEAAPALTYDYGKSDPGDKRAAIIKSSLEKAGFKITLNPIQSGYYATIGDPKLQHDFGTSGWGADWPNASTVIGPLLTGATKFNNASDYPGVTKDNNPDWYKAFDAAISETDRAQQSLKWQAMNKEAAQKAWIIPNAFTLTQVMAGDKITTTQGLYKWPAYGSWPYGQIYVVQQ
jgi:peptide/nickel transport system substrate-binding protein